MKLIEVLPEESSDLYHISGSRSSKNAKPAHITAKHIRAIWYMFDAAGAYEYDDPDDELRIELIHSTPEISEAWETHLKSARRPLTTEKCEKTLDTFIKRLKVEGICLKKVQNDADIETTYYWCIFDPNHLPLHFIAQHGKFKDIPKTNLNATSLLKKDRNGNTVLHFCTAHLKKLPKEILTLENLTTRNKQMETIFHWAAREINLDKIPQRLLTKDTIFLTDNAKQTVFSTAAEFGSLDQIPREFITLENLKRTNAVPLAAENGHLDTIPEEFLTFETLNLRNKEGKSAFELTVKRGRIYQLPKALLSPQILLLKDQYGKTQIAHFIELEKMDNLLGMELPETFSKIVGRTWYEKNQRLVHEKHNLTAKNVEQEIELF